MPHFLVLLYGTDAGAASRRQAARDAHLGQLKEKVASGKVVFGGRIFDDAQQPIGSFMIAHCADRTELDAIPTPRERSGRTLTSSQRRLWCRMEKLQPRNGAKAG